MVPVDLVWEAPAECPSAASVVAQVEGLVAKPGGTPIRARATVTHERGGMWAVQIATVSAQGSGERRVEGRSCAAVAEATALILALAVDHQRAAPAPPAATSAPPAQSTPPAEDAPSEPIAQRDAPPEVAQPEPAAPTLPARTPASGRPREVASEDAPHALHEWGLALGVVADAGTLPHLGPGVGTDVAWIPRYVRVEIGAAIWVPQRASSAALASAGGDFTLWLAHARGCWVPFDRDVAIGPCAGATIDHMAASGFGADVPRNGSDTWADLFLGGVVTWRLTGSFSARGAVDMIAPFARPRFTIEGLGLVHKPGPLAARVAVGLEVRAL